MVRRTSIQFPIKNVSQFKKKLLCWAQQFNIVAWLDSNNYKQQFSTFDAVLAIEAKSEIKTDYKNAFEKLKNYQINTHDYIFGFLGYDLKNDLEKLSSQNFDGLAFPDLYFFQPKKLIFIKSNLVEFNYLTEFKNEIESDLHQILNTFAEKPTHKPQKLNINARISKSEYLKKLNTVLNHIQRGNIYEANFCQEFYSENATIHPVKVYQHLNEISKPPFATFLKLKDNYVLSASPERYLKKEGQKVISQPIKGTAKRAKKLLDDQQLILDLQQNKKERAENIMIVDLVRNDLSHIAIKGSVKVEELCKVYTFKQVHQLISTISCEVKNEMNPVEIIKKTYPMGSMTGAPKIAAMKIIEEVEDTKRGLYSGAVGYFTPQGNFDFNVIIRSILYNASKNYVSFSVGSAITSKSIPEMEFEECLLKAKAMKQVLSNT